MELRLEEISKIIRSQIKHYESTVEHDETGSVVLVGDGIARVSGLDKCEVNELVEFPNGEYGMALNLEEDTVAVVLLGSDVGIREGDTSSMARVICMVLSTLWMRSFMSFMEEAICSPPGQCLSR